MLNMEETQHTPATPVPIVDTVIPLDYLSFPHEINDDARKIAEESAETLRRAKIRASTITRRVNKDIESKKMALAIKRENHRVHNLGRYKLREWQVKAVVLRNECPALSLGEIAKKIGISPRVLYNWSKTDEFDKVVIDHLVWKKKNLLPAAMKAVEECLYSKDQRVKKDTAFRLLEDANIMKIEDEHDRSNIMLLQQNVLRLSNESNDSITELILNKIRLMNAALPGGK